MSEPLNPTGISFGHWRYDIGEDEAPSTSSAGRVEAPEDEAETCNRMTPSIHVSGSQLARPEPGREPLPAHYLEPGSRPVVELCQPKAPAESAVDPRADSQPERPLEADMETPSSDGEASEAAWGTVPMVGSRIRFEFWRV